VLTDNLTQQSFFWTDLARTFLIRDSKVARPKYKSGALPPRQPAPLSLDESPITSHKKKVVCDIYVIKHYAMKAYGEVEL
jgi:hypothetical protein